MDPLLDNMVGPSDFALFADVELLSFDALPEASSVEDSITAVPFKALELLPLTIGD